LNLSSFLFIHYHYPPIKNSGVYRNYFLSTAIANKVTESFLITTNNRKILPNEAMFLSPKMKRYEAFTLDYRKFFASIYRNSEGKGAQFSEKTKDSRFVALFIKIQRSFPFNILLAEGSVFYIIHSYFIASKLIKERKVDVVYSSFMPYADHIIAWLLKKKFSRLIWIADFRDLHVEPIYKNVIWPDFQKKVEKFILKNADIVTTVSQGISMKMMDLHHNVHTITKGVNKREPKVAYEIFTIHYSGSLFQNFRDPRPLFRSLQKLIDEGRIKENEIQFLYAGKDGQLMTQWVNECGIREIFVNQGMVSRNEVIEMQDRSHINLLLTSASDDHTGLLTGKLFEYIEAGKQILCIVKGSKDLEIEALFDKFGLGTVFYSEDKLSDYIYEKYLEFKKTGKVKSNQNHEKVFQDLSWQHQADKVLQMIDNQVVKK
jgi:hypothetical protein